MTRSPIVILLSALLAPGCKSEAVNPDPELRRQLDVCNKTIEEKNKLVQAIQDESARQARGSEIVVAIEGTALTVRPGKPGEVRAIEDKVAAAGSKEFLDVVTKSRGAIQKCYEQALKKNTALQAHAVILTVSATFSSQGAYQNASFSASTPLGEPFETCMRTVASKWKLPTTSAMTFKTQVSLTPS